MIDRSTTIKEGGTDKAPIVRANTLMPKDPYKDSTKKDKDGGGVSGNNQDSSAANGKDDNKVKNGPMPTDGIQFENKSQLIYYKRQEMCRSIIGLPLW